MESNKCKHINKEETDFIIEGSVAPIYTLVKCLDCGKTLNKS